MLWLFAYFLAKSYQRRSRDKSHQNGDYLNQAMRISFSVVQVVRGSSSGPVILRLQVQIPWDDNFFALLVWTSRRSGGSSIGLRAGSLWLRKHANNQINH